MQTQGSRRRFGNVAESFGEIMRESKTPQKDTNEDDRIRSDRLTKFWRWLAIGTLLCLLIPMRYTLLKIGLLAGGVSFWFLTLYLFGDKLWVRAVCIVFAALALASVVFLMLPGDSDDPSALRQQYVRCLLSYKGTLYVWGGGNHLGIDCSGLVERGLIDADLEQGIATLNPKLARLGLSLWWHNRSARALGAGYRGDTFLLRETPSLDEADYKAIEPGDLAVMSDGIHVLAYVGTDTWIEADPKPMRVILAHVPRGTDYYFNSPVRIMRWRELDHG
jgi:hypothetical protein